MQTKNNTGERETVENAKANHTPGPWIDDGHDGQDTQIVNSKWGEVARVVYNGDCSQRTANARLIAAAPELLAALKSCVERMAELQKHTNYPLAWPRVQAMDAIAKAEGH